MSNSTLVDTANDKPGDIEQLKKELAQASATKPAEPEAAFEDEPEKYRGKSREEIMKMHQNAEKKIGQTGNELGQYKQLTDQLLDFKRREDLAKGGAEPEEEDEPLPKITQEEILDDPDAAVARAVEARLSRAERKKERKEQQTQEEQLQAAFLQRHPDAEQIAQSEEFQEFVSASPSRQMLAAAAINAGNLFAANTLLDEWKTTASSPKEDTPSQDENIAAARRAATVSTGSSTASDAPKGKEYKRLDLIRLKLEDPEMYGSEAFQQEIMRAYAEGRVK